MIITVFGATGKVGKLIVQMALARGFEIRAFGRNVQSFLDEDLRNKNFSAIKGYVFDETEVLLAIKGSDVILSGLGGSFDGEDKTRSLGMRNIIKQMKVAGIKRIIAVGGAGVLKDDDYQYIFNGPAYPDLLRPVAMEYLKAYEYLKASDLDWTFVCCPDIRNEKVNGKYIVSEDYPPSPNLFTVSAGNVADFMLNEITLKRYIQKRVGISDLY